MGLLKSRLKIPMIDFASTLGVSNFVIDEKGYIKVHEGECLVVVSKD